MSRENYEATELKHAEEAGFAMFPAADQSAEVVKPSEEALSGKGLARCRGFRPVSSPSP